MLKLTVSGCQGRMGKRIVELAFEDPDFHVMTLLERADHPQINERINGLAISTNPGAVKGCDVLIEFTSPEATMANLQYCLKHRVKMVIGTTGLSPEQIAVVRNASEDIAIVYSTNMSIGVNILFKAVKMIAEATPETYTVLITEAHHIHKKDAPSGTAKTLADVIEKNSAKKIDKIDSIREGEIIGDHKVVFESPEDTLTIEHHAKTRDIFAKGALVAAKFLLSKTKGLYHMQDVLGLS